jgi:hypothetical protein
MVHVIELARIIQYILQPSPENMPEAKIAKDKGRDT